MNEVLRGCFVIEEGRTGKVLVAFVDDAQHRLFFFQPQFGEWNVGLGEQDDDLCALRGLHASLYAHLFNLVFGTAYSCCIYETEGDSLYLYDVFDEITGGALDVADDGPVLLKEGVEQGALAGIGFADDGYGHLEYRS